MGFPIVFFFAQIVWFRNRCSGIDNVKIWLIGLLAQLDCYFSLFNSCYAMKQKIYLFDLKSPRTKSK